jgi:UDP-N-acetylmuramyl pentapeptide phosphotransferase/UDP-N-acetylglucosamine-1-phosphate transferase
MTVNVTLLTDAAILALAAGITALSIPILLPWLRSYALARPNARSSHREPTPQGGGIAVIASSILVTSAWLVAAANFATATQIAELFAAVAAIAIIGAIDDIKPMSVAPRLLLQAVIIAAVIATLPNELRVWPRLPWWPERAFLLVGGLWFVNLVNFMDGLDWMTVAEVVPITAALALVGRLGILPAADTAISLALCGAMIGFAWFNRPVARLFLGDVGSLPIGLLLGWLLLEFAGSGHLAAAVILPLYYLADATVTLLRRAARLEPVWQSHRSHFYQRATDRGFTVLQVVALVFAVNLCLGTLALATIIIPGRPAEVIALTIAAVLVAALLFVFERDLRLQRP